MKKFLVITIALMFLTGCMTIQSGPTVPEIPVEFQDEWNANEVPGWDERNAR